MEGLLAALVRIRARALRLRAERLEGMVVQRTGELAQRNLELIRLHKLELDEKISARLAEENALTYGRATSPDRVGCASPSAATATARWCSRSRTPASGSNPRRGRTSLRWASDSTICASVSPATIRAHTNSPSRSATAGSR